MKNFAKILTVGAAAMGATAANATVPVVTAVAGCAVYCGPTPITYDFDTTTPSFIGGQLVTSPSVNAYARPLGGSNNFFGVQPTNSPATILLGNNIGSFSFIWGSIDTFNTLTLTTLGGTYTYTGSAIAALIPAPANGNQTAGQTNPIVTFLLSGLDQMNVSLTMRSTNNAFEIDDIAVSSVPEPATWAMMLLGFGAIGFTIRRRKGTRELTQLA